jgi:2,4-dichlorophenol 6-monooxygenase
MIETDVLIIGSGPAGLAAAALLSTYGISNLVVTKYGWLSDTPRAHISNQRTMEVLRDLGVEEEAKALATPQPLMANNVFCYSMSGEEFARLYSWGNQPARKADYDASSPSEICDLPQNLLEPVLLRAAAGRGSKIRFDTELVSLSQDTNEIEAIVRSRTTGETYPIRAKYLIGADGGRSIVAEAIGLEMKGEMGLSGSVNIVFDADLTRYAAYRPSVLYWILQPGAEIGGLGAGVIRMVRPWHKWMAIWGYDMGQGDPRFTDAAAERIVRDMIGDEEIPIAIGSISCWKVNNMYAANYSVGRVFCMGDAVHRHAPLNGLGSNTSIQDAYNLAWKLAFVLTGKASPGLLETYSVERQPIGQQIVDKATASISDYPPIFEALGLTSGGDPAAVKRAIADRKAPTMEGKLRRQALREAVAQKNYEFNTHGVELNQRYRSAAIMAEPEGLPAFPRDPQLYYAPTTAPGAHVPHAWVEQDRKRISILDLCGRGHFTLLTGIGGEEWRNAASEVEIQFGVPIQAVSIGPSGCDAQDIYEEWRRASEVDEDGCVLVRPDMMVTWRSRSLSENPGADLTAVFERILAFT